MTNEFGFIREKLEIKILVLFVMSRLSEPISLEALIELAMCDEGISYFELTQCVKELVDTEHLRLNENLYSITRKGEHNGQITETSLPFSVRQEAEARTAQLRAAHNRNSMIKTSHLSDDLGGYKVHMSLSDGVSEIVSLDLLAGSEKQAKALEKGFRKNAENIYHALIEMIIGGR